MLAAGAKIPGAINIGECRRIGANAVVVDDVPKDSVVVGVPGHAVHKDRPSRGVPDLDHDKLPDTVEEALEELLERVEKLENKERSAA